MNRETAVANTTLSQTNGATRDLVLVAVALPRETKKHIAPVMMRSIASLTSVLLLTSLLACGSAFGYTHSGSTYTTNGSASDVQSATNVAPNGSRVVIPDGTYVWSSGITCNKPVTITGASVGGVTITDNFSGTLVSLTPSTAGTVSFANVSFVQGSVGSKVAQHYIMVTYSPGSKPVLIHDCRFSSKGGILSQVVWQQNGGVIWNCTFDGGNTTVDLTSIDEGIQFKNSSADLWKTPSTMGAAGDPNGTLNTYVEDCSFNNFGASSATDFDDGSRTVFRHNTLIKAAMGSHGADTSPYGNRHWEVYDNSFIYPYASNDPNAQNLNGAFIPRGGTGVITGNSFCPQNTQNWGPRTSVTWLSDAVTQIRCYTRYPIPRALGQSWSGGTGSYSYPQAPEMGSGYITEPVYMWGNTTNNTYQSGNADTYGYVNNVGCNNGYTTQDFIQPNRDFFFDNGAKPGWSRFTYPHPLRTGGSRPSPPRNLRIAK